MLNNPKSVDTVLCDKPISIVIFKKKLFQIRLSVVFVNDYSANAQFGLDYNVNRKIPIFTA